MNALATYQTLKGRIKAKPGLQTLDRVKEACDTLEQNKVKITVASVGQECEVAYGSPKEGSIRNLKHLVAYIKERAEEQKLDNEIVMDTKGISDPVALAYINSVEARAKIAERNFTILKKFVATQVPPMDIDKFLATADPKQFSHLLKDAGHAPVEQAKVLKEIADTLTAEKRLAEFGLELYKGALRHKVNGQILLTKEQLGELK